MINNTLGSNCFFGASNSSDGFYSLFDKIFTEDSLKKLYILKGGPGCGKSTLLKRIAGSAEKKGFTVKRFLCSSSPSSLDGIIISELSCALIDGTSPHSQDPKYPAVCGSIVNLGEGWDLHRADEINDEVRRLTRLKVECYTRAYAYLSSIASAREVIDGCTSGYILTEKMRRVTERLVSRLNLKKRSGKVTYVITDSVCGLGRLHLTTLEENAEERFFVKEFAGTAHGYFKCLFDELSARGVDFTAALDPIEPLKISGIYIPEAKTSFTFYDDDFALSLDRRQLPYKIINTARFCDKDLVKRQKSILKFTAKAEETLFKGAVRELKCAADTHEEIESLYKSITDYGIIEKITSELEEKILG